MKKYQYKVFRYIHDHLSGEFVNVGIVLFDPSTKFLKARVINKYSRLTNFFSGVEGHEIISILKGLVSEIDEIENSFSQLFTSSYNDLDEIVVSLLKKDDFSIQYSNTLYCIDIDPQIALMDLFERLVSRYIGDTDKDVQNDSKVWSKVYKKYFDKYQITSKLSTHSIKTSHDVIEFDKAWKNGVWNCFQPLSFDLKRIDSIKNKVYKWSGILGELETSSQNINLYLLTTSPIKDNKLNKFITDTLTNRSANGITITIVKESEAESFAKKMKMQMEKHS